MPNVTNRDVPPADLKAHPLNIELYGSVPDPVFVENINQNGIGQRILAAADGTIVAGHRRWQAAKILSLAAVPVTFDNDLIDPLRIREMVIRLNQDTRERTNETKAREFAELERIEKAKAEQRKAAAQFKKGGKPAESTVRPELTAPEAAPGRARDKAAAAVGLKPATAKKMAKVVEEIDRLREGGEDARANDAAALLNEQGPDAAARALFPVTADPLPVQGKPETPVDRFGSIIPPAAVEAFKAATSEAFAAAFGAGTLFASAVKELAKTPLAEILPLQTIQADIKNARQALRYYLPYAVCPYCKGQGGKPGGEAVCPACGNRLWITETAFKQAPDDLKPESAR